eukprot:scaffold689_cov186-Amphora_coffeaeformis.AAC.8
MRLMKHPQHHPPAASSSYLHLTYTTMTSRRRPSPERKQTQKRSLYTAQQQEKDVDEDNNKKKWFRPWWKRVPPPPGTVLPQYYRHGLDAVKHYNKEYPITALVLCQCILFVTFVLVFHKIIVYATAKDDDNHHRMSTEQMPALDFVVAGFPKCGTTTLLYAFGKLPQQILMSHREVCTVKDKRRPEDVVRQRYRQEIVKAWDLPSSHHQDGVDVDVKKNDPRQRGMKCPTILYSDKAIDRLLEWYPTSSSPSSTAPLRWILGMRHPMQQVLSYYNYLITEVYDKGYWLYKGIRTLESIIVEHAESPSTPWKDMAYDTHMYEIHLERLLSRLLVLQQQQRHHLATDKNRLIVFIYTLEQLQDDTLQFQKDLSTFVGLPSSTSLALGHENRNRFTGALAHPETIDLCAERFDALRDQLLQQSRRTAAWIEEYLLSEASPYHELIQIGGGVDALRNHIQPWKHDICDGRR